MTALGFPRVRLLRQAAPPHQVPLLSRRPVAASIWIVFVLVQALDGVMTMFGIYTFGPGIEANPIIAFYAAAVSPEAAVSGAKLLAVACGAVLHLSGHHAIIAALSVFYALVALVPWAHVLLILPS